MKQDVKDILLESAIEAFAEHGYRDAKIADIVKRAKVNIAAVNYHFGSKEQLFVAALRRAYKEADAVYPSKGNLTDEANSKDKIATLARAILRRSFDGGKAGNFNRIMNKTVHIPTSPIETIMTEVEQFELKDLSVSLKEYLNTDCQKHISWAVGVFISLATMISKCPSVPMKRMFGTSSASDCPKSVMESMIEAQIKVIFAALSALPSEFPNT